ncbi:hypothetical protein GCM10009798_20120 [Nocardioides panacihumi]|uniref:DUF4235 domain-containing protein n=1 Tax=Nocardioides panacihumi TaxID=400774 RepID=A0ABP5C9R1_9ACTN
MAKGSQDSKGSKVWTIFSLVSALGAATVARKGLDKGWQVATRRKPPENPADPDVALWEAVAWSAATGAAVALARMFAQRRAANYYVKSAGHLPPQLEKDDQQ